MSIRRLHRLLEGPSCSTSFIRHLSSKKNLPSWFNVPEPYERPPDAMEELLAQSSSFRKGFEKEALKDMFENEIKPSLIARCIWLPKSMEISDVKKVHFINKRIIGQFPLYVTSMALSKKWVTLRKNFQAIVINSLAAGRVMVQEEWEKEGPSIDMLFYDHGLQFAPHSGSSDDMTFKAECDARFYQKSKTATAASIIWKCGVMIDAQISWGISCRNSGHAEAIALCNVLTRGKELDHRIEKLDVVIDHEDNCQIMSGAHKVPTCDYSDVYVASIQTLKQYEIGKVRWQPREMLGIVNEIAKTEYSETLNLTEILEGKAGYVLGDPFLRIQESKKDVIDKLGKDHVDTSQIIYPVSYYLKVQDDMKYDALLGMISAIDSYCLIIMVGCEDIAYRIAIDLSSEYYCVVKGGSCLADEIAATLANKLFYSAKKYAFVVINEEIPPFPSEFKTLLICYDNNLPTQYTDGQSTSEVKIVNFISDEKDILPGSKEVDPFLFGFFHSREIERDQEKFRIMSYNWCGEEERNLLERIFALKDLVEHHRPDLICFQNVTPKIHLFMQKFHWWGDYFCSRSYPEASHKDHYILQVVSEDVSLAMRTYQANEAFRILDPHRNVILCGDMNWNEAVDGKFPVPNDCWIDAWDEVEEGKEGGETYMLPAQSTRSDRVFCKISDYKLDKIEVVGKPDSMISHLGIVTTIRREFGD